MVTSLVVFSGGLDSILAVKVLEEQNIKVTGLSFDSYFFDTKEAKKTAKQLGIDLIIKDISELQLDTVKNPQYGHGSALNPCIDCHGLMFRVAGEVAELVGPGKEFDLVATGEVLGQRPFSQNSEALKKVEKLAGVDILRPLSAKLLPETIYEKQGLVDREKLLDISGKSRKRQLELVKKYGVEYFPSPAGGCRLTENEFGLKVKKLLDNDGQVRKLTKLDFELLRIGRHYWLPQDTRYKTQDTRYKIQDTNKVQYSNPDQSFDGHSDTKNSKRLNENNQSKIHSERVNKRNQNKVHIILGKNYEENEQLKNYAGKNDLLIETKKLMGPTGLIVAGKNLSPHSKKNILTQTKKFILKRIKNSAKIKTAEVEWRINFQKEL